MSRPHQSPASGDLCVCLLGLGEAGSSIGSDLISRGVFVRAWDPDPTRRLDGVHRANSTGEAVAGSDVVLSINSASAATKAVRASLPALTAGQLYVDLNSGSGALKVEIASLVAPTGALFVDAALMDGVPGRGLGTRCIVSGPGAETFADRFRPFGMPMELIGAEPGAAAKRKLLRSIFAKGIAAVAEEAVRAGRAAGCEEWLRNEISRMLATADESLLDRLLDGARRHASRRRHEMEDVIELLQELNVEPRVTVSTMAYLDEMARDHSRTAKEAGADVA